jgi:hypothetical protein
MNIFLQKVFFKLIKFKFCLLKKIFLEKEYGLEQKFTEA